MEPRFAHRRESRCGRYSRRARSASPRDEHVVTPDTQVPRLVVPVGSGDHARGPEHAPVALVEYGDYACPDCGFAYPIVKSIQKRLGDRLRFVFRNFPLVEAHPNAENAAEAAEAAGAQGKFWEMH